MSDSIGGMANYGMDPGNAVYYPGNLNTYVGTGNVQQSSSQLGSGSDVKTNQYTGPFAGLAGTAANGAASMINTTPGYANVVPGSLDAANQNASNWMDPTKYQAQIGQYQTNLQGLSGPSADYQTAMSGLLGRYYTPQQQTQSGVAQPGQTYNNLIGNTQQGVTAGTVNSTAYNSGTLQQYLDPYTNQVVDATKNMLDEQHGEQNASLQAGQAARHAFGDRADAAKQMQQRNQNLETDSTLSGIRDKAFTAANQQFNQSNAQSLQAQTANQNAGLQAASLDTQRTATGLNADISNRSMLGNLELGYGNLNTNAGLTANSQNNSLLGTAMTGALGEQNAGINANVQGGALATGSYMNPMTAANTAANVGTQYGNYNSTMWQDKMKALQTGASVLGYGTQSVNNQNNTQVQSGLLQNSSNNNTQQQKQPGYGNTGAKAPGGGSGTGTGSNPTGSTTGTGTGAGGRTPARDANGNPVMDANGNVLDEEGNPIDDGLEGDDLDQDPADLFAGAEGTATAGNSNTDGLEDDELDGDVTPGTTGYGTGAFDGAVANSAAGPNSAQYLEGYKPTLPKDGEGRSPTYANLGANGQVNSYGYSTDPAFLSQLAKSGSVKMLADGGMADLEQRYAPTQTQAFAGGGLVKTPGLLSPGIHAMAMERSPMHALAMSGNFKGAHIGGAMPRMSAVPVGGGRHAFADGGFAEPKLPGSDSLPLGGFGSALRSLMFFGGDGAWAHGDQPPAVVAAPVQQAQMDGNVVTLATLEEAQRQAEKNRSQFFEKDGPGGAAQAVAAATGADAKQGDKPAEDPVRKNGLAALARWTGGVDNLSKFAAAGAPHAHLDYGQLMGEWRNEDPLEARADLMANSPSAWQAGVGKAMQAGLDRHLSFHQYNDQGDTSFYKNNMEGLIKAIAGNKDLATSLYSLATGTTPIPDGTAVKTADLSGWYSKPGQASSLPAVRSNASPAPAPAPTAASIDAPANAFNAAPPATAFFNPADPFAPNQNQGYADGGQVRQGYADQGMVMDGPSPAALALAQARQAVLENSNSALGLAAQQGRSAFDEEAPAPSASSRRGSALTAFGRSAPVNAELAAAITDPDSTGFGSGIGFGGSGGVNGTLGAARIIPTVALADNPGITVGDNEKAYNTFLDKADAQGRLSHGVSGIMANLDDLQYGKQDDHGQRHGGTHFGGPGNWLRSGILGKIMDGTNAVLGTDIGSQDEAKGLQASVASLLGDADLKGMVGGRVAVSEMNTLKQAISGDMSNLPSIRSALQHLQSIAAEKAAIADAYQKEVAARREKMGANFNARYMPDVRTFESNQVRNSIPQQQGPNAGSPFSRLGSLGIDGANPEMMAEQFGPILAAHPDQMEKFNQHNGPGSAEWVLKQSSWAKGARQPARAGA